MPSDLIAELKWRGLFHQCTDEAGLHAHLASGMRRGYVGYDPTADSLTIGNLVTIMLLRHLQNAGHQPVVVSGGGTGLIGDPSGKSAERTLMTEEIVRANVEGQRRIYGKLLDFSPSTSNHALITNNMDWLGKISFLEALRDIGKHFSVNEMIRRDSVRDRLNNREQGISYTEFSYILLQAYDFAHLHKNMDVTLQMGGSDQWGNIVGGVDLIRRYALAAGAESTEHLSFGLTAPLVTKADGGKFGKTESGAIWLTADRTSPYAYYQFWLNCADADVARFLRIFTLLPREEIERIEAEHAKDPGQRIAQRTLAREATTLLHGKSEMENAESAAKALFSGDVASLPENLLEEVLASAPSSVHNKSLLSGDGGGVLLVDLLVEVGLASSKRESREFLTNGAVSVNGRKASADERLTTSHLLHGRIAVLQRGKKARHVTRWE
ncbi:MAG: tyrosine--tRNA ligase [Phycisphaeraceae bacterium]|nr:tyrosine--tRNA ligase [Phycisphaeraceae bacterium]MBX3366133.1 tyrosine--tRNA ligase [Phycisphaeraceae bacterium]